jgi:uncharacterized membrane protein YgcG
MIKRLDKSLKRSILIYKFAMINMNHWQKKKQKTTTITTRIPKLSFVVLTSAVILLSSVGAVQLRTNNAYAQDSDGYSITSLVCTYDETVGEFGTYVVTATFDAAGPSTIQFSTGVTGYFEQGGQGIIAGDPDAYRPGSAEDTLVVTVNLYEGLFFVPDTPPEDALRDTATVTCEPTSPPPDDDEGGDDEEEQPPQPPLTDLFDNQGECIAYADANPDSGITREECNAAFVPGGGCQVTEETEETLEEVCTGGGPSSSDDDPSTNDYSGGGGGHGTCTLDKSTDIASCTFSGGGGSGDAQGGGGGRTECTYNNPTGEQVCSFEAGGSKPVPDEGG